MQKLGDWIKKIEGFALLIILITMIGIGFAQIILRNFFNTGLGWADLVVRHLFFIGGFFGAILATQEGSHLGMDLLSRFLPERFKRGADIFLGLVSCAVCGLLARAGYHYVLLEKTLESPPLFEGLPSHWGYAIIPIGFILIGLQFLLRSLTLLFSDAAREAE